MNSDLPPDLAMLSRIVDGQPPQVRELVHYVLVMLLIEDGKAAIIEQRTIDAREWITVRTTTPEMFSIVEPDVAPEQLEALRTPAREVLDDNQYYGRLREPEM